jgi:hypothetical protein
MWNFLETLFMWTGVVVWYTALVLLFARIFHGPRWWHEDDEAFEAELQRRRDNARWS